MSREERTQHEKHGFLMLGMASGIFICWLVWMFHPSFQPLLDTQVEVKWQRSASDVPLHEEVEPSIVWSRAPDQIDLDPSKIPVNDLYAIWGRAVGVIPPDDRPEQITGIVTDLVREQHGPKTRNIINYWAVLDNEMWAIILPGQTVDRGEKWHAKLYLGVEKHPNAERKVTKSYTLIRKVPKPKPEPKFLVDWGDRLPSQETPLRRLEKKVEKQADQIASLRERAATLEAIIDVLSKKVFDLLNEKAID